MAREPPALATLLNGYRYEARNLALRAADLEPEEWERAFQWLDAKSGCYGAWSQVSRALGGVDITNLKLRYMKRDSFVTRHGPSPRLGWLLEQSIVDHVKACQAIGSCVHSSALRPLAKKLAMAINCTEEVGGQKWEKLFYGRHPDLAIRQSQIREVSRVLATNREAVRRYFDILTLALEGLGPGDIYIMDEAGIETRKSAGTVRGHRKAYVLCSDGTSALTISCASPPPTHAYPPHSTSPKPVQPHRTLPHALSHCPQVIATKGSKTVCVISTEDIGHISLVACLNATGEGIPPSLIFEGKRNMKELGVDFPEAAVAVDAAGYMNEDIFRLWAERFVAWSGASITHPVALIVDNHYSHLALSTLVYLRDHNVRVVGLHPHTTHVLCALDVSFFRGFKANLERAVFQMRAEGKYVTKYSISGAIRAAYVRSTEVTLDPLTGARKSPIISGFRATGVYPLDTDVLTDDVFAMSDSIRSARDSLDPAATQEAATAKPTLALSASELQSIRETLLCTPIPIAVTIKAEVAATEAAAAASTTERRGRQKQKSELLTSGEFIGRIHAAQEAKLQQEVAVAVRKEARVRKAASNKLERERRAADFAVRKAEWLAAKAAKAAAGPKPKRVQRGVGPEEDARKASKKRAARVAAARKG